MNRETVIGIDTSNYTTSVALVSNSTVLADERKLLKVKEGERGLRQSDAFFQHVQVLPELMEKAMFGFSGKIAAVAVASRPRPVEGSYMPVFTAGMSLGRSLAASFSVPYLEFSHQEGHIAAIRPEGWDQFQCFHMSGGTSELLHVKNKGIQIIGGSRDISLGQLLDRVGVAMGYSFPAGAALDSLAEEQMPSDILREIPVRDGWIHLSGIESQCQRVLVEGAEKAPLAAEIFHRIAEGIVKMIGERKTLLVGGVSSSMTLRKLLRGYPNITIPEGNLGGDNGVGIAYLGGEKIWQ